MLPSTTSPIIDALFWVAVTCCVVAQVAIVRSVMRAGGRARVPHESGERRLPRSNRAVELLWLLVPTIGLAAVLVATWHTMHPRI
jgi:heme/copper-type cytochrome/quinol oxidase subunit 2